MPLKIRQTKKDLSVHGGLLVVEGLLERLGFAGRFRDKVPNNAKRSRNDGITKLKFMLYGFICDCQCLDDFELLARDPLLKELAGKTYTARTLGSYLRSFTPAMIKDLQDETIKLNLALRADLERRQERSRRQKSRDVLILDCDSTKNQPYGLKMEGVQIAQNSKRYLDTQNIYDELGFQYHLDVRAGNSHSSKGAGYAIGHVIRMIKADQNYGDIKVWTRADSGYYGADFINNVKAAGSDIIVKAAKTKAFPKNLSQIPSWRQTPSVDLERIKFYDDRECELASTNYRLSKAVERSRHVVVRAVKDTSDTMYPDYVEYDYFAIATSLDEVRLTDEELIKMYRKRGNAESFIRESKYGFDLLHYPCASLDANRAFGAIAMLAYNIMRWLGLAGLDRPKNNKPRFSKYVRNQILTIPCRLMRSLAKVTRDRLINMSEHYFLKVRAWLNRITNVHFGYYDSTV